jgi:hypothetical protein
MLAAFHARAELAHTDAHAHPPMISILPRYNISLI